MYIQNNVIEPNRVIYMERDWIQIILHAYGMGILFSSNTVVLWLQIVNCIV